MKKYLLLIFLINYSYIYANNLAKCDSINKIIIKVDGPTWEPPINRTRQVFDYKFYNNLGRKEGEIGEKVITKDNEIQNIIYLLDSASIAPKKYVMHMPNEITPKIKPCFIDDLDVIAKIEIYCDDNIYILWCSKFFFDSDFTNKRYRLPEQFLKQLIEISNQ